MTNMAKGSNMLLSFGAKNFYCFKEGVEISLELGSKCPESLSRGKSVSNLLCIKGANGSGKTNVIKIISFLSIFCCNSFNNKPEDEISLDTFFDNDDPTNIFCEFDVSGIKYKYELCLTKSSIISETLSRTVRRESVVFERKNNELVRSINEFSALKKIKLRSNASIISTAHQYEYDGILPFYEFFNSIICNVNFLGKRPNDSNYRDVTNFYKNNEEIFKSAIEIIKNSDLGIANIEINEAKDEDGKIYYFPTFEHDVKDADRDWLTYHYESTGTQTLFKMLPSYLYILKHGGVLAMDEFDTDLHPHILPKIVTQFEDEDSNPHNAQMIFSTHNTEILDHMGKYRTVLINKESSESYAYRLDEIPGEIIRNDRPIAPVYNSGRIGGVPRV